LSEKGERRRHMTANLTQERTTTPWERVFSSGKVWQVFPLGSGFFFGGGSEKERKGGEIEGAIAGRGGQPIAPRRSR
jgi:hypothetical protein